jgi:hypothetical protein
MLKTVLAFSFLVLLASCVSRHTPYPDLWSPPKNIDSVGKCPSIAGLYHERGEASGECPIGMEACTSLSYDLLVENIGYKEHLDRGWSPNLTVGDFLELRQPADNRLVIIQWQSRKDKIQIVSEHVLRMEKGDFSCGADGLTLTRSIYFLQGISNTVGSVSMRFKASEDASLILKSNTNYMAHHVFVPYGGEYDSWVRWLPATKEQMRFEPISRAIDDDVRKIIYADQSQEDLLYKLQQGKNAKQGEAEEQLQLYYNAVKQDPVVAHRWLCESADQGHPEARYRLAILYENGSEGIRKDSVMAYVWYTLAGESGEYWGGRNALRLMKDNLSTEAIKQAEDMVRKRQPGQCEHEIFGTEPNNSN